jgi:hypothetical protein
VEAWATLTCRSPAGRSPPIPGEISPDQVKDGGKDRIGKWFYHLTLSLRCSCLYFLSDELSVALLKVRALITCLITNLSNDC